MTIHFSLHKQYYVQTKSDLLTKKCLYHLDLAPNNTCS